MAVLGEQHASVWKSKWRRIESVHEARTKRISCVFVASPTRTLAVIPRAAPLNPRRIRCEVIVKSRSNDASNRFDYESCSRRLSSNFRREYEAKLCHGLYIHRLNEFEQILLLSTLLILSHTFF